MIIFHQKCILAIQTQFYSLLPIYQYNYKINNMTNKPKPQVENISCIIFETQQQGGLFLGNVYGSKNAAILKEYGIRAVLTTSIQTPTQYKRQDIPYHLTINAHDKDDYSMMQHLDQCLTFIEKYRKVTNVFVHCFAGVSRSATVVIAYLMKKYRWSLDKALGFVVCKRIVAKPNDGFMKQLRQYEKKLFYPQAENQISRIQRRVQQNQKKMTIYQKYQPYQVERNVGISPLDLPKQTITSQSRIRYNHDQIPIPKILGRQTARTGSSLKNIPQTLTSMSLKKDSLKENILRPRDLPGFGKY